MKKATTSEIVAIVVAFISLFVYFDWPAKLRNRIVADRDDLREAA